MNLFFYVLDQLWWLHLFNAYLHEIFWFLHLGSELLSVPDFFFYLLLLSLHLSDHSDISTVSPIFPINIGLHNICYSFPTTLKHIRDSLVFSSPSSLLASQEWLVRVHAIATGDAVRARSLFVVRTNISWSWELQPIRDFYGEESYEEENGRELLPLWNLPPTARLSISNLLLALFIHSSVSRKTKWSLYMIST